MVKEWKNLGNFLALNQHISASKFGKLSPDLLLWEQPGAKVTIFIQTLFMQVYMSFCVISSAYAQSFCVLSHFLGGPQPAGVWGVRHMGSRLPA